MRAVKTPSLFHSHGFRLLIILAACLSGLPFLASLAAANDLPLLADLPSPTGVSRRWSAGLPISPYSQVDMKSGRVITALPVTGWGGRGPGISLTLYHNMTSAWGPPYLEFGEFPGGSFFMGDADGSGLVDVDDIPAFVDIMLEEEPTEEELAVADMDLDEQVGDGDFDGLLSMLEVGDAPMWSHTYQTCLVFGAHEKVTVIWGDGTRDVYTHNESGYIAPSGVFNKLQAVTTPITGYKITTKSQYIYLFNEDGRLETISDPSGNTVTCHYIDNEESLADGELSDVEDSSGRQLTFAYNDYGKLAQISDPLGRHWNLLYYDASEPLEPKSNVDGPFVAFEDAMEYQIKWTYTNTDDWDIGTITDKDEHTYTYEYTLDNGRLLAVTDPLIQETGFWYTQEAGKVKGKFTDVRGNDWLFKTSTALASMDSLLSVTNPLNQTTTLTYTTYKHDPVSVVNALGKFWHFNYDSRGNVLEAYDPYQSVTTYTFDSLNNLLTVTPPGTTSYSTNPEKKITYVYGDGLHPTSPTEIQLPADGQGNAATSIVMEYYDSAVPEAYGLLKSVTDANGVQTKYEYDTHGHVWRTSEGDPTGSIGDKVIEAVINDPVGQLRKELGYYIATRPIPIEEQSGGGGGGSLFSCIHGYCLSKNECNEITDVCCCCAMVCAGTCHEADEECDGGSSLESGGSSFAGGSGSLTGSSLCPAAFYVNGAKEGPSHYQYNAMSQLTGVDASYTDSSIGDTVAFELNGTSGYDLLGRTTSREMATNEFTYDTPMWPAQINRSFSHEPDSVAGTLDRTGPDGQVTHVETDDTGRVTLVTRGTTTSPMALSAAYTYYASGQVHTIVYGNGAGTTYTYDNASRLTRIEHKDDGASLILKLDYTYARDGLITQVDETDAAGWMATVVYTYDNRNKLIEEERTARSGQPTYHFSYTYDQGGNRLMKTDYEQITFTQYHYDLEDISTYHTWNNRLMYYEVFDNSSAMEPSLLERVDYEYDGTGRGGEFGNPTHIVRTMYDSSEDVLSREGTTLQYNHERELLFANKQHSNTEDTECEAPVLDCVREFAGIGRGRYMTRLRGYEGNPGYTWEIEAGTSRWSDFDKDIIYSDYIVESDWENNQTTIIPAIAYLPGVGQMTLVPETGEPGTITYLHSDHLGSLRAVTESNGDVVGRLVYTAFGEKADESGTINTRYTYVGSFGYETSEDLPFLHVGHRYYDPSTGRFLQRDPIGISGGINIYDYVAGEPVKGCDPFGLQFPPGVFAGDPWPWDPFDNFPPSGPPDHEQPQQEFMRLQKIYYLHSTCAVLLGSNCPLVAVPHIVATIIDELTHINEPLNPLWGGDYEVWQENRWQEYRE